MTTDFIVEAIDRELQRLRTIRAILLPLLEFGGVPAVPRTTPVRRPRKPYRATSPSASVMVELPAPKLVKSAPAISFAVPVSDAAMPEITRLPSRESPIRRIRRSRPLVSLGALSGAVPSAPVMVRPASLPAIELPLVTLPEVEPYSFAAMVRAAEQGMSSLS